MASFNKVILAGNLTRDPELRYTPAGAAVCEFGIAVNRRWKDKSGESKEQVSFIDCVAWAKTAELVAEYLKKGSGALLEGFLVQDRWEDQSGQKRSKVKVTVQNVQFLSKSQGSGQDSDPQAQAQHQTQEEDIPF